MNKKLTLALLATATMLAACGGDGGDNNGVAAAPPPPAPAPAPAMSTLALTVVDGPISGAKVCLDKDGDGLCGANEPSATSTAGGAASLVIPEADVGKYPVVAEVPAGAVDEDDAANPVVTAYRLSAPVGNTVLSPLSTVVQQVVKSTGVTPAAAAASVQSQVGLTTSPLNNYLVTATADPLAANAARMLVVALQEQTKTLGTSADTQKVILANAINLLEYAVREASDPSISGPCADRKAAGCKTAIAQAAGFVVADAGLTPTQAQAAVTLANAPAVTEAATPAAGFQLDWVNAGDTANWYTRILAYTAAENTPDANGLTRYRSIRQARVNGTDYIWNVNNDSVRAGDLHWNGSAWAGCGVDFQSTSTVRDAQGRGSYNYCGNLSVGNTVRTVSDISGRAMSDIFSLIQATRTNGANWGKPPTWFSGTVTSTVGTATLPTGSRLISQDDTMTSAAIGYDVRAENIVTVADADVAAGGNAVGNNQLACNVRGDISSQAVTLETMVARNPGKPCIYNQQTDVGLNNQSYQSVVPNEGWGNSTTSMGNIGNAPTGPGTTAGFYTTNLRLRVSFAGGGSNAVTYYLCQQRAVNASTRNCGVAGTGTFTIAALGDARVMTFAGLPAVYSALGYDRVFVERGGQVYFGYQDRPRTTKVVRLNGTAGNAVLSQLGLPTYTP